MAEIVLTEIKNDNKFPKIRKRRRRTTTCSSPLTIIDNSTSKYRRNPPRNKIKIGNLQNFLLDKDLNFLDKPNEKDILYLKYHKKPQAILSNMMMEGMRSEEDTPILINDSDKSESQRKIKSTRNEQRIKKQYIDDVMMKKENIEETNQLIELKPIVNTTFNLIKDFLYQNAGLISSKFQLELYNLLKCQLTLSALVNGYGEKEIEEIIRNLIKK